jgi:hypothetical protein
VLEDPHDRGADIYDWRPNLPTIKYRPCTGSRFGELVSVSPGAPDPQMPPYIALEACYADALSYLGLPSRQPTEIPFGPAANPWVALAGPDVRQRAIGQAWSACLVYLPISADADHPISVDHSLKGAWQRPDDSRLLAMCVDDPTNFLIVNCWTPHRFELLSLSPGLSGGAVEPASEASCRQEVIAALGSSAALDRGDLAVLLVPVALEPNAGGGVLTDTDTPAAPTYVNNCLVMPADSNRRLTSSLRGIGDAPVPLD